MLFDFEVDSQVVHSSPLGKEDGSSTEGRPTLVSAATLRADFLRHASEWPGDSVTQGNRWLPPLVRLVAYRPSSPLRVTDDWGQPQRSFAVQGWGIVAVVDGSHAEGACPEDPLADPLPATEAQRAASVWVSHLRSWLALPPDGPLAPEASNGLDLAVARPLRSGVAVWELRPVARAIHELFLQRAAETLERMLELIDSLPDVIVREEVGKLAFEAVAAARRALLVAAEEPAAALRDARHALALALTTSHDDTVVAQTYFSWEFKAAVYLPLTLPFLLPITVSAFREFKSWKKRRAKAREPPAEATEVS